MERADGGLHGSLPGARSAWRRRVVHSLTRATQRQANMTLDLNEATSSSRMPCRDVAEALGEDLGELMVHVGKVLPAGGGKA